MSVGAATVPGTPLQVAGDAEWASVQRTRVDEAHTTLLEVRFWARLELGGAGSVVGELEGAVAERPFHEGLWELLITALYRTGRQADALAAYQRVRTQLAEELGLDPGPALQRLERDILAQDVAAGSGDGRIGRLRRIARATCRRCRSDWSAVTLTWRRWPGCCPESGSSRSSVRAGSARPRSPSRSAGAVDLGRGRRRLAGPAGERSHPRGRGRRADRGVARTRQRGRPLRAAPGRLRARDPGQLRARRGGGRRPRRPAARPRAGPAHPVHQPGPARDRWGTRGRARAPGARPTRSSCSDAARSRLPAAAPDDESVLDLCRSLDGLPLAIELAAARTRTLTVEEITRRLDDRFSVLKDPSSRRPERRRSLRSTIGWSYELLFPDDQRGLWALSAFAGGAPLPAVEFVLEALGVPAAATIDVVDRLVDPVAGHPPRRPGCRWRAPLPAARQHPGLRAARRWRKRRGRARARRARPLVRRRGGGVHIRRTQRRPGRAPPVRPDRAREHRRGARVERRARPAARPRHRLGVRLGLGRPGRQPRRRADRGRARGRRRTRHGPRAGRRPAPGRLDRGIDR